MNFLKKGTKYLKKYKNLINDSLNLIVVFLLKENLKKYQKKLLKQIYPKLYNERSKDSIFR